MEKIIQILQEQARALRESYEATTAVIPWGEVLRIVQGIEKLGEQAREREKRENNASNAAETRLKKIEKTLEQLARGKEENEGSKKRSYAEAATEGCKEAPAGAKNKKKTPDSVKNDRQRVVVRILDKDERERVNNLPLKEIIKKINQGNEGTHPAQQILAAKRLPQGEIALYTEKAEVRTMLQGDQIWAKAISPLAQVKGRTYEVLVKRVRREGTGEGEENVLARSLESQNKRIHPGLKIVRLRWLRGLKEGTTISTAVLEVASLEGANGVLSKGLVQDMELKSAERFDRTLRITQCFKCQGYGHISRACTRSWKCGHCAENHRTGTCEKKGKKDTVRCGGCSGKHEAWASECPVREQEWQKIRRAHQAKPKGFTPSRAAPKPPTTLPQPTPEPSRTTEDPESDGEWTLVPGTQKRKTARPRGRPLGSRNRPRTDLIQNADIMQLFSSQGPYEKLGNETPLNTGGPNQARPTGVQTEAEKATETTTPTPIEC
jgi:hypothetical protein